VMEIGGDDISFFPPSLLRLFLLPDLVPSGPEMPRGSIVGFCLYSTSISLLFRVPLSTEGWGVFFWGPYFTRLLYPTRFRPLSYTVSSHPENPLLLLSFCFFSLSFFFCADLVPFLFGFDVFFPSRRRLLVKSGLCGSLFTTFSVVLPPPNAKDDRPMASRGFSPVTSVSL